jgi:hypothetical protein
MLLVLSVSIDLNPCHLLVFIFFMADKGTRLADRFKLPKRELGNGSATYTSGA